MPGEFRVKESCAPCKKRKSKCDAQQPCASCILRNSQDRCQYAHGPPTNATPSSGLGPDRRSSAGDHRSSPYPIRPAEMAETSSAPTKRAMTEIMKLKTSIHHLEGHVRELSRLENGLHMEEEPATTKEKDNWKTVLGVIPGKAIVEVLLEYNIQEDKCGWLWQCGDIVSIWERAIRRGGVSASEAGLMCLSLALPSYVLGASQAPLYRLPINTDRLHNDLFDVSRHFATSDPQTLDDLAHYCALIEYQVFSGRHNPFLLACAQAAARAIRDLGYIDEGRPVWATLDTATRERARDIVRRIVSNYRWAILTESTQDVLHNCRVNLCDPSENLPSLKGPIDLALPGDPDLEFRIFRPISRAEQQQGLAFVKLFVSIDRVTPDIRAYKLRLSHGYPTEMEKADLVSRCQSIYTTLLDLRDREAVQAGFGDADIHSFDLSIPTQARKAAMILLLHNAIEFLMTTVTRHWLTNNHPSNAAEQTLHDVCLQTATRAMQWMDVSKSLVTMKNAPFVPAFASANLFNAAIAFTVPVLRAVKLWTTTDRDGDIKDLPSIPDNSHHHVPTADNTVSLGDMSATRSLPATIYIDGAIRSYANNILLILDTLKALSVSPLGEETEKRLEMLIQRYGLSDSRDWDMPIQQPPPLPDMSWNGNTMTTWTTPPEGEAVDPNVLNQLLLLDPSIWQGIMNQPMGGQ